jgi:hypothetical protein
LIPIILVLGGLDTPINTPLPRLYAQPCESFHNTGIPIIGLSPESQTKTCSSSVGHLTVFNEVNNSRCSSNCASTSNYFATVIGNGSKSTLIKTSGSANVALKPGNYAVIAPRISGFYEQTLSPGCAGTISAGESIRCTIMNSYANNIQTWLDKLNNIKIQFSYSPPYPFVGNLTQLSFQATNSDNGQPIQISHIRMALITNVTANFNTSKPINNGNNFVTFENISSNHGAFSLNYSFTGEGSHQIILGIIAKNNEPLLASFSVPVLLPE